MSDGERASPFPFAPLPSPLRTPEQMSWIHDRFKVDGLERLARSTQDYYDQKGYYLPDVAALAHAALLALDNVREAIGCALLISRDGETKMPREDWLRIEAAMLRAGCETPVVFVETPDE